VAEGKSPSGCVVREVMSEEVSYAIEDEDVGQVACKMAEWQVRRLPVLDHDHKLVGIVSLGGIALLASSELVRRVEAAGPTDNVDPTDNVTVETPTSFVQ
jgi:CBS-domain-containing membrane protein